MAEPWHRILGLIGRAMLAWLFLWSGLFGIVPAFPAVVRMIADRGLPAPSVLAVGAGVVEIAAPLALFFRRTEAPAALSLAIYCFLTATLFHAYWAAEPAKRFNEQVHFLKDIALSGAFLLLFLQAFDRRRGDPP
jgi:putative oxidoreductase